jgi:hypothetical protein
MVWVFPKESFASFEEELELIRKLGEALRLEIFALGEAERAEHPRSGL